MSREIIHGEDARLPVAGVLSSLRSFIKRDNTAAFLAGGVAGALSRTAVSPFERVKVLYQVQGTSKATQSYRHGVLRSVAQIWREEGLKGLYRGNGVNCFRVFPYSAVQYSVYQQLKSVLGTGPAESRQLDVPSKLFAGAVAGMASVVATYPLDLVKTRLSVQTASLKNLSTSRIDGNTRKPPGMFRSLVKIYTEEGGVLALYRGLLPTILGVAPYVAINFSIYEKLKEQLPVQYQHNAILTMAIGAVSGGIGQSLIYPFDILRRRFQVLTLGTGEMGFKYNSIWDAFRTIWRTEGTRGLFKGWVANMWKIMPSMAVQWASYDLVKELIKIL
ncbi:unnamed protein product [Kuraishia capsulata CBS 1993]|uniref:Mitochondrial carrier protein n=1 Tax=Kuraishia capsulata CBS 1993 TaxID=1382522 RepID=W6MK49_9ASCO|nr:uncharacterized protein KUCA_T00002896001 [Kuraishia capsulata CBS 1993]CDK26919.1 unnamed protein product [Kuraishia capsulata CBS 1993]